MTTEAASDLDLFETEATGQPVARPSTIPDKFKGKTVEDMIHIAMNAEKKISEQGRELGQVRRMADEILQLKKPTTETRQVARTPVTVETLLNDPEKALQSAVSASDIAQRATEANARVDRLEASIAETTFVQKHKDFANDLEDPAFIAWVNKSPVRVALGAAAAEKKFEAATNLWDLWQEHKELTAAAPNVEDPLKEVGATKKTVPTGVKSAPAQIKGKPIYSRSKLMELRMKAADPDSPEHARYYDPTFQANMHAAYAEDRVR